jgi:hypothetical protein
MIKRVETKDGFLVFMFFLFRQIACRYVCNRAVILASDSLAVCTHTRIPSTETTARRVAGSELSSF